jgi:hypothetical protein
LSPVSGVRTGQGKLVLDRLGCTRKYVEQVSVMDPSSLRIANNNISLKWLLGAILHKRNKHKHNTITRRSDHHQTNF